MTPEQIAAAVKPLIFSTRKDRLPDGSYLVADCAFGRYYIADRDEYGFGWKRPDSFAFQGCTPSEAEAKAAAQAHYVAAVLSMLDMSKLGGWQPIETAPKDGARVLLWVPPYGPSTGHFDVHASAPMWRCHSVLNREAQPTHWMPLPPAPTQEGE